MKLFLKIKYNGTRYAGYQVQDHSPTVQRELNIATADLFGFECDITGCSRTDAGVHANEYFFNVRTESTIPAESFPVALASAKLPKEISIYSCEEVDYEFNARFDCVKKEYEYVIENTKIPSPFLYKRAFNHKYKIDVDLMNEAAQYMIGQHDFASFCRVHTDVKTTLCHVMYAQWENGVFRIKADRFLRNMVRAVVGTLLDVGKRKVSIEAFQQIILAKNRCAAGQSAPAEGLYLVQIDYPENIFIDTI